MPSQRGDNFVNSNGVDAKIVYDVLSGFSQRALDFSVATRPMRIRTARYRKVLCLIYYVIVVISVDTMKKFWDIS